MSSTFDSPRELRFNVHGMDFSAQQWGDSDGIPVLALHGWLDNSASFYRLAPLLKGVNLVALDMAGHGLSDHRAGVRPYNIWEDISEIFAVADCLDWGEFSLLGHSRGAIVAHLAAGTFPNRILKAALLDGFFPQTIPAEQAPEQLALSIMNNERQRDLTCYPSIDCMIKARQKGRFKLSYSAAKAIVTRGSKPLKGGFSWCFDPHLLTASAVKLSTPQLHAFAKRATADRLLILAQEGIGLEGVEMIKNLNNFHIESVAGDHHFHMDEPVHRVASRLNDFFIA